MEEALLQLEEAEIRASNTPLFIREDLRAERLGADASLEKVLNWWRSDIWIPPEMRIQPKPACAFCQVLNDDRRFLDAGTFVPTAAGYRIIMNNKWVFPNHFLIVPSDCTSHVITPARIEMLSWVAKSLPSLLLYVTSRGLGVPQHFHGHLVLSPYVPPLVKIASRGLLAAELLLNGACRVSEIQEHPAPDTADERRYIAGWAITGQEMDVASILIDIACICSEEILLGVGPPVDLFWGPQLAGMGEKAERTVFVFPRRADGGKHKERLGATEFVGLFAFSSNQFFVYSRREAVTDLIAAGVPYADRTRERISERIRSLESVRATSRG
jgi:hypothetical protein